MNPFPSTAPRVLPFLCLCFVFLVGCGTSKHAVLPPRNGGTYVIVFQPSHQTDTGRDFNEALTCNAIVEEAMARPSETMIMHKVWSHDVDDVHHARTGSNTKIEHTSAPDSLGRISGYAWELSESNKHHPDVFIAVHNNGGTNRHALWGFVHEGDRHEALNRELAAALLKEICSNTDLENRGVLGDSSPNRNDYRCRVTGKLSFYSLDENVNSAPYRVLLEVGDNQASRNFLANPENLRKVGQSIRRVVNEWFGGRSH